MNELKQLKKDKRKEQLKGNWKEVTAICNYMGGLLSKAGNYEEALEIHKEELQICESQNDLLGIAIANRRINESLIEMRQYKQALNYGKKYLEYSMKAGSQLEQQRAWSSLGITFYYIVENGDLSVLDEAEKSFKNSLELVEKLRNKVPAKEHAQMKARILHNIGLIYEKRGNRVQCIESMKKAIFLTKKNSLTEDLHRSQYFLGNAYEEFGNLTCAVRFTDEAILSAKILNDKDLIYNSLLLKVQVLTMLKDFHGAKVSCKKAYKIKINDQITIEKHLKGLHFICNFEDKLKSLTKNEIEKKAIYLEKIGDVLSFLSYYKLAIQYYIATLENLKEIGKHDNELTAIYFSIAQTYADDEQYDKALEYFQKELNGYIGNEEEQCKTLLQIANILEQQQNFKQLKITYEKAVVLAENSQQLKLLYQCLQQMKCLQEKYKNLFEMKEIERKLDTIAFDDEEAEVDMDEDIPEFFNEISVSDISDCTDNEIEEDEMVNFPKRSKKTINSKCNYFGETPLHRACIEGNLKFVKNLVENGHIINPRDNCGWIPLHEACNYGYYDIVKYLLKKGAWINDDGGESCEGITPLHDAANCGHIDVMRLLIEKGASIKSKNSDGDTPLDCLKKWRERSHCDLDSKELQEILNFEKELFNKLKQNQELNSDEELSVSNLEIVSCQSKSVDKRQHSLSVSSIPNFQNFDLSYDEFHNTNLEDNIVLKNNISKLPNIVSFSSTGNVDIIEIQDKNSNIENCKEVSSVQDLIENSSETFSKPKFCVKVKVEDKLFLIPVNNVELTINWLECEASRRYYNLVGKKPQLQLNTYDGAILTSEDSIGSVLTNCEEVLAVVKTWELPSITERYKEFSVKTGLKCQQLLEKFQTAEISGKLSIKNIIFNIKIAKCIFYAIQYQENITILNFNSFCMGDELVTTLATSLITLCNLTFLGLRCCELTAIGIQNIVKKCFLENNSKNKPLQNLEKLDIAYNPIGPKFLPISNFLKYCTSLTSLDLTGCDIESCTLQDNILISELKKKKNFYEIYLANNKLNISGFTKLFENLQVSELKKLDLSSTVSSAEKNIGIVFKNCFSRTLSLLYLSLRGCYLQNDDIAEIEAGLISCKTLQYLDLSANPGLSMICIEHLLHSLSSSSIPITYLNLSGSINWTDDISEIYFTFSNKLDTIIFSVNNRLKYHMDKGCSIWKNLHGKHAKCVEGPGNIITFTLETIF